ncbi:Anaphase-promoting complex subunit 2 [Coemansia aciculifera]|uniref:Anaphase-promoting complex subunit 2 n=1 Tax=Coemansia aciculifera TaxID=417176 RepID=A0A9W8IL15_9FUNG|nr:Anaphase-promoting complex subunit 2 [Coemansia aciculifera]
MYACSPFNTLSEDDIQRIVQQIKARPNPAGAPWAGLSVEKAIDSLATEYRGELQQLCTAKRIGDSAASDVFHGFLQFLQSLNGVFCSYSEGASRICGAEQRIIGDMAWNALIYQVLDTRVLAWMEEWLYVSLSCVLHCVVRQPSTIAHLNSAVDSGIVARLQQVHRDTGAVVVGFGNSAIAQSLVSENDTESDDTLDDSDPAQSERRKLFARIASDPRQIGMFVNDFASGCRLLVTLRIVAYASRTLSNAVDRLVDANVQKQANRWDTPCLDLLLTRVRLVATTLDALLCGPATAQPFFLGHAEARLYAKFSELRVSELFGIIIDYPDSRQAIADLRACVVKLRTMRQMAHSLRNAIQQRLLHPGATTSDILTQYISAIRCLRLLDPSSTVLEIVARPIRSYLRSREDTVSCIVQDMVSEESELFEDLASGHGVIMDNGAEGVVYDEDYADKSWEPLPIEAKNVYLTAQRRDADVLSLLVSIYETKDVFVQEFERHLAQRLLACTDYSAEREIRQVEMMKLRFGDRTLEKCEVMLKDVADSKRTDQHVSETSQEKHWDMPLHALIVSRQFWSSMPKEQFAVPHEMADMRNKYAGTYESLKPARKLEWRDALGSVTLRIELADRTVSVSAKPAQAAVLFAFQETPVTTLAELAQKMECSEEFVLSRVRFWQTRGVVRETDANAFEVVEAEGSSGNDVASRASRPAAGLGNAVASGAGSDQGEDYDDDDEGDASGGAAGASNARTEALRVHFNFVEGILRNFGPLPLDRILSMLGMFMPGENTTAEELRSFLALMAREDKLEMAGGLYKLK